MGGSKDIRKFWIVLDERPWTAGREEALDLWLRFWTALARIDSDCLNFLLVVIYELLIPIFVFFSNGK